MTRTEAWLHHCANLTVGGTGLVYGWMRYFAVPEDPFSLVGHPAQPQWQHAHLLLAPLLIFVSGMAWPMHAWMRMRMGFPLRRKSGIALMISLFPMIVSGYLIQTAVDADWRNIWAWVHGISSCLWILAYLVHQFMPAQKPDFESIEPEA